MGRTNGKLLRFLSEALENSSFVNLNWIDPVFRSFRLLFPRFDKRKELQPFEDILIKWYLLNDHEYQGYSKAKAVLKAALKKSVYIVSLQRNSHELCFRFASKDEIIEKRRKQRERTNLIIHDPLLNVSDMLSPMSSAVHSPDPPPSDSSGYFSGNEELDENFFDDNNALDFNDDDILKNLENLMDYDVLDNIIGNNASLDDAVEGHSKTVLPNLELNWENITLKNDNLETSTKTVPENVTLNGAETMHQSYEINDSEQPVVELTATVINPSQVLNTYWLCTKKVTLDSTLLLICEKQVIKDENQGFVPGNIYLNNVFKPDEKYNIEKSFEFDGKYFLFLLPDN